MSEPVALFLTINGMQVSGESVQQSLGRAQSIECVHYHQVVEIPVQTGSGKATARRQYGPLLIRKRIDKASPLIARALIQQSVVDAVFKFFRTLPDGTSEQFYATHISHARVASLGQYVPDVLDPQTASEPPLEEVTFVFEAIEWTLTSTGVTYEDSWRQTNGSAAAATAPSPGTAGADKGGGALGAGPKSRVASIAPLGADEQGSQRRLGLTRRDLRSEVDELAPDAGSEGRIDIGFAPPYVPVGPVEPQADWR